MLLGVALPLIQKLERTYDTAHIVRMDQLGALRIAAAQQLEDSICTLRLCHLLVTLPRR